MNETASCHKDSSINSTSRDLPKNMPSDEHAIQSFCKKLLKSRMFIGEYSGRRLVSESIGYRDAVNVSQVEEELTKDLRIIRNRLKQYYPERFWIGITKCMVHETLFSNCLWVELPYVSFGLHWFQIKTILFRKNEALLKLQCVRSLYDTEIFSIDISLIENDLKKNPRDCSTTHTSNINGSVSHLQQAKNHLHEFTALRIIGNMFAAIKFLFVAAIAFITGTFYLISNLGDFTLRLFSELSLFTHTATPIVLGLFDFCSKVVGGFYILLAMFVHAGNPPRPALQPSYTQQHAPQRRIMYNNADDSGVRITEVD